MCELAIHNPGAPGSNCGSRRLRIRTPTLLAVFGGCKHPPDSEFVVQGSVNAKEHLFQRVGDFSFFGEFFEKSLQLPSSVPPLRKRQTVLPRMGVRSSRSQSDAEISRFPLLSRALMVLFSWTGGI